MKIDWRGISHSAWQISDGKQKSRVLALVTPTPVDEELLNGLVPSVDEGFPGVGSWCLGPGDAWLLAIQSSGPARRHVEALARNLERAGITGAITGVKPYRPTRRLRRIARSLGWTATLAYRPTSTWEGQPGWLGDSDLLDHVTDHLVDWITEDGGQLTLGLEPELPYSYEVGRPELRSLMEQDVFASAQGYRQGPDRVRRAYFIPPTHVAMSQAPADGEWLVAVEQLSAAMRSAPLDQLCAAMLTDDDWFEILRTNTEFNGMGFLRHPELWDEYLPFPSGVQILTDKHLDRAHNLDDWDTTRLNDRLYVVHAKDLSPWYRVPWVRVTEAHTEAVAKARLDFGDMLFTHATAER
ncbi:MAG: hypothetical protein LWW77_10030, partial [Propionibacteriales bacterium]|nr:hypothetical protein [Propionibacteriales bacterium]